MDVNNLGQGERIAGISAVLLFFIMFISWFGYSGFGFNAWESFGLIDIILFVTIVVAIGVAVMAATATDVNMPVAGSAIVAALGILSVLLILYRIIDPPGGGTVSGGGFEVDVEIGRKIGVFLGLIAAGGIAYGGWMGMQEEGTSFGDVASGFQGGGDDPPPPPSQPPNQPPAQ